MQQSDAQMDLAKAFCAAQGRYKNPKKNIESEDSKYKTAPLSRFFQCVKKPNLDNQLGFLQNLSIDAASKKVSVSTRLIHSSGQWLESDPLTVSYEKETPEDRGLAIYNAKKNSFCAMFGITGENEVEEDRPKADTQSNFPSANVRREAKEIVSEALKKVTNQIELTAFYNLHEKTIQKLVDDDPQYISDVIRDIKLKKQQFDGENLAART